MPWALYLTDEVDAWLNDLATSDRESYEQVVSGIEVLAEVGPNLGLHSSTGSRLPTPQPGGTAPRLSRWQRASRVVHLRPMAQRDPAGRRRQGRELVRVVPAVDPQSRGPV